MVRMMIAAAVVLVAVAAGWHYRDRLQAAHPALLPPPAASAPAAPDVLYTWVDEKGVTHYSQQPGKGREVRYDGSTITPLAPPDSAQVDKLKQAAGEAAPASSGNALLDLRRELEEGARQIQASQAAQSSL